jgi:NADPH oxidase
MAAVNESWFKRAGWTLSKVLFHLFFWGLHIGIFAVGWYVLTPDLDHKAIANGFRYLQASDARLAGLNVLGYSVWISRGAGLVLSVDCTLILFPMCRNILKWLRPQIRWLPLDESAWFHRQIAYSMLVFTAIHTAAHYVKYVSLVPARGILCLM